MKNPRLKALTETEVKKAAKVIKEPGVIQRWSVVIGGVEYPVKEIVREAANLVATDAPRVTPADFIAHEGVRILRRLGFDVRYYER